MAQTHYESYTDDELAILAKTDREAFNALLYRYVDSLRYDAGSFADGRKGYIDADDYHSEGVLGLMSAVRHYDPNKDAGFATFARVCASNRMKNAYNKSKRVFSHETAIDENVEVADKQNELYVREMGEVVKKVIDSELSSLEAEVLLGYLAGNSYKDIAQKLGISQKSVDNALTRIRKKLRSNLW